MSLPKIKLEVIGQVKHGDAGKFLNIRSYQLRAKYDDKTTSKDFVIDTVVRRRPDAVVIIPYYYDKHDEDFYGRSIINVYIRSCLRPAVGLRTIVDGDPPYTDSAVMWEFAAGLIEENETPVASAKRELEEEIGFKENGLTFIQLGLPFYSSPGLSSEQLYIFAVEVDETKRLEPTLDGGEMEKNGAVEAISLQQCFGMIKRAEIKDSKTEIGLRRLEDLLGIYDIHRRI